MSSEVPMAEDVVGRVCVKVLTYEVQLWRYVFTQAYTLSRSMMGLLMLQAGHRVSSSYPSHSSHLG